MKIKAFVREVIDFLVVADKPAGHGEARRKIVDRVLRQMCDQNTESFSWYCVAVKNYADAKYMLQEIRKRSPYTPVKIVGFNGNVNGCVTLRQMLTEMCDQPYQTQVWLVLEGVAGSGWRLPVQVQDSWHRRLFLVAFAASENYVSNFMGRDRPAGEQHQAEEGRR